MWFASDRVAWVLRVISCGHFESGLNVTFSKHLVSSSGGQDCLLFLPFPALLLQAPPSYAVESRTGVVGNRNPGHTVKEQWGQAPRRPESAMCTTGHRPHLPVTLRALVPLGGLGQLLHMEVMGLFGP